MKEKKRKENNKKNIVNVLIKISLDLQHQIDEKRKMMNKDYNNYNEYEIPVQNNKLPEINNKVYSSPQPKPQIYEEIKNKNVDNKSYYVLKERINQLIDNQKENNLIVNEMRGQIYQLQSELNSEKEWRRHFAQYNDSIKEYVNGIQNKCQNVEQARSNDNEIFINRIVTLEKTVYDLRNVIDESNQRNIVKQSELENNLTELNSSKNDLYKQLSIINTTMEQINSYSENNKNMIINLENKVKDTVSSIVNDQMEQKVVIDATLQNQMNKIVYY